MVWPVDIKTVSQEFGQYPNSFQPDGHTGMDFAVPIGTKVHAVADGKVLHAGWASELGWPNPYYVAIDFDGPANGDQSAGIVVIIDHGSFVGIYAHLDQTGLNVDDTVSEGEIIAQTGNTGRSTGAHLHFEVLPDQWDVHSKWYGRRNPRNYVRATAAIKPSGTITPSKGTDMASPKENWDFKIQEFAKDGRTPTVKKSAGFILGQLNQWFTRVLEGQATIKKQNDQILALLKAGK